MIMIRIIIIINYRYAAFVCLCHCETTFYLEIDPLCLGAPVSLFQRLPSLATATWQLATYQIA